MRSSANQARLKMEEYAINLRVEEVENIRDGDRNAEIEEIPRRKLVGKEEIRNNGAIFCQVIKIVNDTQDICLAILRYHKCIGMKPNFNRSPKRRGINKVKNGVRDKVDVNKKERRIIKEPSA